MFIAGAAGQQQREGDRGAGAGAQVEVSSGSNGGDTEDKGEVQQCGRC
jgi:hypothetical protein